MTNFFIFFFIVNRWKFITRSTTGNVLMYEIVQMCCQFQETPKPLLVIFDDGLPASTINIAFIHVRDGISYLNDELTIYGGSKDFISENQLKPKKKKRTYIDKQTRTYANHGSLDPFSYLPSLVLACVCDETERNRATEKANVCWTRIVQGRNEMNRAVRIKGFWKLRRIRRNRRQKIFSNV